jgi:hypothetical protein
MAGPLDRPAVVKNPPDLASARVSRSAAIWAAAITAVGGFATAIATGALGLAGKTAPHPVQRWIRIDSVELAHDATLPSIDRVRLVAQVNGVSYSYPTSVNSVWAPVGPGMTGERYPLPIGAEVYRVKFFGFGLTAEGKIPRYEFRGVFEHPARQIPLRNATQALQLTTSEPRGLAVGMTVHYSIE